MIAEIIFGPLLATVFLVPFLTAGAMGVGFAIVVTDKIVAERNVEMTDFHKRNNI